MEFKKLSIFSLKESNDVFILVSGMYTKKTVMVVGDWS